MKPSLIRRWFFSSIKSITTKKLSNTNTNIDGKKLISKSQCLLLTKYIFTVSLDVHRQKFFVGDYYGKYNWK
jgi:hypothetical protein